MSVSLLYNTLNFTDSCNGNATMPLHFEEIMEILGFCHLPVICGVNGLGKTRCAKAALSLISNDGSFYSSAKERFIQRLCNQITLPPVLDDIKKPKQIKEIVVAFCNRGNDVDMLARKHTLYLSHLDSLLGGP